MLRDVREGVHWGDHATARAETVDGLGGVHPAAITRIGSNCSGKNGIAYNRRPQFRASGMEGGIPSCGMINTDPFGRNFHKERPLDTGVPFDERRNPGGAFAGRAES